jgi:hypothetical protein
LSLEPGEGQAAYINLEIISLLLERNIGRANFPWLERLDKPFQNRRHLNKTLKNEHNFQRQRKGKIEDTFHPSLNSLFPWPLVEFVQEAADLVDNLFSLLWPLRFPIEKETRPDYIPTDKPHCAVFRCSQIEKSSCSWEVQNAKRALHMCVSGVSPSVTLLMLPVIYTEEGTLWESFHFWCWQYALELLICSSK